MRELYAHRRWYDRPMGSFPAYVQVMAASLMIIAFLVVFVTVITVIIDRMAQDTEIHCSTTTLGDNP